MVSPELLNCRYGVPGTGVPGTEGCLMKADLDHLPPAKAKELARVQEILFEEFEATANRTPTQAKKDRRILKIVLFGSYARGDWVEDPKGRYFSDYDPARLHAS